MLTPSITKRRDRTAQTDASFNHEEEGKDIDICNLDDERVLLFRGKSPFDPREGRDGHEAKPHRGSGCEEDPQ